jgi:hypothetical protein
MSIGKAMSSGFTRATSSRRLVLWLWLTNFAVALPAAWVMAESLRGAIGDSLVQEKLRSGFDMGWFGEFDAAAKGLETTFTPTLLGAGAFYSNLEAWLSGDLFRGFPGLVGLGILYGILWALLLGGVLQRFAGNEGRFSLAHFFSTGGKYFFRFIRLALLSGILYYLVYRLYGWLFRTIEDATRDVTVERTVFLCTLLGAAFIAFLLALVNMVFDYAKIATVLESRRSMLLASLRGLGFVLSYPGRTLGLYYGLGLIGVALLAVYALIAPGAGQSTPLGVLFAFVVGQVYLVLKLLLRLVFYGGQMALYEELTRPGPAAAAERTPESPAAAAA